MNLLQPFYCHKFINKSLLNNKTDNFKFSKILFDLVLRKFILVVLNEIKNIHTREVVGKGIILNNVFLKVLFITI